MRRPAAAPPEPAWRPLRARPARSCRAWKARDSRGEQGREGGCASGFPGSTLASKLPRDTLREKLLVRSWLQLGMIEDHDARLKPHLRQQPQPVAASEKPFDVPVVFGAHRSVPLAQQVRVIDDVRAVGRIGIVAPFEVAQPLAITVVATVARPGLKGFADTIRREERDPTGAAMVAGRLNRPPQIV